MAVDRRTTARRCNTVFGPHRRLQDGEERKEGSHGELTLGEAQPGRSFWWRWRTTVRRDSRAASPWEIPGVSSLAREHRQARGEGSSGEGGSGERSEAAGTGWACTGVPEGVGSGSFARGCSVGHHSRRARVWGRGGGCGVDGR
jgi:hypothetical protein